MPTKCCEKSIRRKCALYQHKRLLTFHIDIVHQLSLCYQPLSLSSHSNKFDKNYMFACRLTDLARAVSPPSPQSNTGKWWSQRTKGEANWKPNTPQPSGIIFFCTRNVPSGLYLWGKIRMYKWHGVPSNGAGASSCCTARGAECRRNSLAVPSGTDLPTMCSCAENCHF